MCECVSRVKVSFQTLKDVRELEYLLPRRQRCTWTARLNVSSRGRSRLALAGCSGHECKPRQTRKSQIVPEGSGGSSGASWTRPADPFPTLLNPNQPSQVNPGNQSDGGHGPHRETVLESLLVGPFLEGKSVSWCLPAVVCSGFHTLSNMTVNNCRDDPN